jgi:hypothetical protein
MASKTEYINMALGFLGQDPTETIDLNNLPANRTAPRKIIVFAEQARDLTLEDHDWLDAQVPVNLSPLSLSGFTDWPYVYGVPAGFVRISELTGPGKWQVGLHIDDNDNQRRVIYADGKITRASAIVKPDWEMLPPALGLAVACKMAWLACVSVTVKADRKDDLEKDHLSACRDAARAEAFNSQDDDPDMPRLQDWRLQAR